MAVSYATQIRPLFRQQDIDCMSDFGVKLDNYAYMSKPANARKIYAKLSPAAEEDNPPRMPEGGPYWPDAQLALYKQWMDDGFKP